MDRVTLFGKDKGGKLKVWSVWTNGDSYIVEHGKLGSDRLQLKTTQCFAKNVNKANETTPEEQAELEAWSKINKQKDKGYHFSREEAEDSESSLPMLAMDYTKQGHRINYPCLVSPKLDGVRCFATIKDCNVTLTSRMGKDYPCPKQMEEELLRLSKHTGITLFDGEIYRHALPLQEIVSAIKKPNYFTNNLEFWIFDLPKNEKGFQKKYGDLLFLEFDIQDLKLKKIQVVENFLANTEEEAKAHLDRIVGEGFEGIMLRNIEGKYEFGKRSADLQKWKYMQDAEAFVIAIAEVDKNGEAVLLCYRKDLPEKTFKCKMLGSHESRLPENQRKLVGEWITFKYQALTNDGMPQFPVGLYVRDCTKDGTPLI